MADTAAEPPNSVQPLTRADWRQWLQVNHTRDKGVWLVSFKRATGRPRVEYDEAVEEALCFGWIDSKSNSLDDEPVSPLARSAEARRWLVEVEQGTGREANRRRLMAPAGLAKVEAARADGSWSSLDAVEALEIPPDLASSLAEHPLASEHFEAFPRSVRRTILEWIGSARRPETRARRVEETAKLASENRRANQWREHHPE